MITALRALCTKLLRDEMLASSAALSVPAAFTVAR